MSFLSLFEICRWLQETPISISIRESILAFPVIEGFDLLGISPSAGLIGIYIDATTVVRIALENSVSVARVLLLAEATFCRDSGA